MYFIIISKAIFKSNVLDKIILILNNESYSDDKREALYKMAIKSAVKRNIKKIAINRYNLKNYNQKDNLILSFVTFKLASVNKSFKASINILRAAVWTVLILK